LDVIVSYVDTTPFPGISSIGVIFDSNFKSYNWAAIKTVGTYNLTFTGTLLENGYVRNSFLIVQITVTPLPFIPVNTGPPIFV